MERSVNVGKSQITDLSRLPTGEAELEDELLGKLLNNRFKILERLGTGGMGRVYKAVQVPLDRPVAVKVLDPRYNEAKDPGFRKRFLLEASLTSQLHHPNTITIYDYGRSEEGIYFIAMEYLEGQTLSEVLVKDGPMNWVRVLDIARQICRSLREAHKLGLVHRDLKPANVMLLKESAEGDVVKVLDFGLVKPFLPDALGQELEITQAGVLLGSPLYMAPEQSKNESDPRSDIYSLGVLLYQMLSGRPPFTGKQAIDVIVKHIREKPRPLHQLQADVPPEVSHVVMKCLEKHPDKRYQSMDELLEALKNTGLALGIAATATVTAPHAVQTPPRPLFLPTPPLTAAHRRPASSGLGSKLAAVGLFLLFVLLGGAIALPLAERYLRKEAHAPVAALAPEEALPAPVLLSVSSEPLGARVESKGKTIGVTPFSMELVPNAQGLATIQLTFVKDGFLENTLSASGRGPRLEVFHRLQPSPSLP